MTTIPTPVTEQVRNWDGKPSRSFETVYTLPTDDPNVWRTLTIRTSYNEGHYYYGSVDRAKVTREVHDYGVILSSSHGLLERGPIPPVVLERGVARYSAKRLREHHDQWAYSVAHDHYGIGRLIEWAEAAK